MDSSSERWVPKVHPLSRAVEAEDPMELVANPVHGDPEVMLECMVQEFAWLGWDAEQLLQLFHSPEYPVLGQLRQHFGVEAVRQRIESLLKRIGVLRVREVIVDEPDPEEEEGPELIQLSLNRLTSDYDHEPVQWS